MADAAAFTIVCERLEQETSLDRLEARGTVRIALRRAGLEAATVSPGQMRVVLEKVLPAELDARSVADGAAHCRRLVELLAQLAVEQRDAPEDVFARLGGGVR